MMGRKKEWTKKILWLVFIMYTVNRVYTAHYILHTVHYDCTLRTVDTILYLQVLRYVQLRAYKP